MRSRTNAVAARTSSLVPLGKSKGRGARVHSTQSSCSSANADTMSDSGAVTALRAPFSSHTVRMDMESLPTGMVRPSTGHSSMPTVFTAA